MNKKIKFNKLITLFLGIFLLFSTYIGCTSSETDVSNSKTSNSAENNNIISDNNDTNKDNENTTETNNNTTSENSKSSINPSSIPAYSGKSYVELNNNVPNFSASDLTTKSFEKYSDLDSLGRCQVAFANVGKDLMPTEKRGRIGQVKPSGWQTIRYDNVDGKYLYNRCHLIGYQLTAENANEKNLITGTRYFNVTGMLPFENMVADYVRETNNHVLYRVTPIFEGNNLVAKGVQMEAMSVEDKGEAVSFNVFVYNIQPGITIDYATGNSSLSNNASNASSNVTSNNNNVSSNNNTNTTANSNNTSSANSNTTNSNGTSSQQVIRGNSRSKIYHCPGQRDYENMADSKYLVIFNSEQEAIDAGYRKAMR